MISWDMNFDNKMMRFYYTIKCWELNSRGDRGYVKEGLVVNSDGFLRCWARGASTLDLVVVEFQS